MCGLCAASHPAVLLDSWYLEGWVWACCWVAWSHAMAVLLPPDTVSCSSAAVPCSPSLLELPRFALQRALLLSSQACAAQGPILLHRSIHPG